MQDESTAVPAEAPKPPAGCEWKHASLVRVGDLIYVGQHDLFGERETFFHRVASIDEKPKTYSAVLRPTHPLLSGHENRRWRKDEWLLVRS